MSWRRGAQHGFGRIVCSFGIGWLVQDARKRALDPRPYILATIFLGSIGLLAYLVRRGVRR